MIETKSSSDSAQIPVFVRMRVEAAMLEMIQKLLAEGYRQEAVALSLADAAEDYVIELARNVERTH